MTTETLDEVAKKKPSELSAEQEVAVELVRQAKEKSLSLMGPDGLLKKPAFNAFARIFADRFPAAETY